MRLFGSLAAWQGGAGCETLSIAESAAAVEVEMPQSLSHMHGVSLPQPFDVNEFLREDERAPFAEFKQRMSDQTALDDITLLRFLRADACKLDKSEARLRATLAWRTARNVDAAIDNPPRHSAEYQRLRVRSWMGEDVQGRPVQFERLGAFFGSGNVAAASSLS